MRASGFVAGVLTQLQKIVYVGVPGFEIDAARAFALAALVDSGNDESSV